MPTSQAQVYIGYDPRADRYVMHWMDTMGAKFSETLGHGQSTGDAMLFRSNYPEGQFQNKLTYDRSCDRWTFHSTSQDKQRAWQLFGAIALVRK